MFRRYKGTTPKVISLDNYRWNKVCRGLYQLPIAA